MIHVPTIIQVPLDIGDVWEVRLNKAASTSNIIVKGIDGENITFEHISSRNGISMMTKLCCIEWVKKHCKKPCYVVSDFDSIFWRNAKLMDMDSAIDNITQEIKEYSGDEVTINDIALYLIEAYADFCTSGLVKKHSIKDAFADILDYGPKTLIYGPSKFNIIERTVYAILNIFRFSQVSDGENTFILIKDKLDKSC